jgi:hypothetical protein
LEGEKHAACVDTRESRILLLEFLDASL